MSVTALTLCFVTLVSLALMPFCRRIVVFADGSINNIDYVESLYTNGGMTDEELAEGELEINETYGQFLAFNEEDELTFSENIQSMDGLDPEIVEMIQNNVDAMNFLVEEGVGYINSDAEFVFTETDDYFQQWRTWNFNLRWNRMWASYDKDFALLLSAFFLITKIALGYMNVKPRDINIGNVMNSVNNETLFKTTLNLAIEESVSVVGTQVANYFSDARIQTLFQAVYTGCTLARNSSIFMKILSVAVSFLMPSIRDCVLIFYNSARFNKGVTITVCWIPTRRDPFGISLKTIR